jgi:hypothetical protein
MGEYQRRGDEVEGKGPTAKGAQVSESGGLPRWSELAVPWDYTKCKAEYDDTVISTLVFSQLSIRRMST